MDADKIKTTRETENNRRTKEAGDKETRHHCHDGEIIEQASQDGEIIEQASQDGEITEQTKVGGAERNATGHRFVAAGEAALSEIGTSENDARPRFYLVVCIGIDIRIVTHAVLLNVAVLAQKTGVDFLERNWTTPAVL